MPGRFEGEAPWVEIAHKDSLDGCWEEHGSVQEGYHYSYIALDDELRDTLLMPESVFGLVLEEDNQGFIAGYAMDMIRYDEFLTELEEK